MLFRSPDVVVYVPSVTIWGRFEEVGPEEWAQGHDALVVQFAHLVKSVLPNMKAKGWARIVTIGSMAVRMLHKQLPRAVPNTYRLAHLGLSKTIADEVGRFGIKGLDFRTEAQWDAYVAEQKPDFDPTHD